MIVILMNLAHYSLCFSLLMHSIFITIKTDKNFFTPLRTSGKNEKKNVVKHSTIDLQLMEVKPTNPKYLVDFLTLSLFLALL